MSLAHLLGVRLLLRLLLGGSKRGNILGVLSISMSVTVHGLVCVHIDLCIYIGLLGCNVLCI